MDWLKTFSANYANAVIALTAFGALLLAVITLWFLKREFSAKYRPYVIPEVDAKKINNNLDYMVSVVLRNVGPHPCFFKLTKTRLYVADKRNETQDMKQWVLLGLQDAGKQIPIGRIDKKDVVLMKVGSARQSYVEVSFILHVASIEKKLLNQNLLFVI